MYNDPFLIFQGCTGVKQSQCSVKQSNVVLCTVMLCKQSNAG